MILKLPRKVQFSKSAKNVHSNRFLPALLHPLPPPLTSLSFSVTPAFKIQGFFFSVVYMMEQFWPFSVLSWSVAFRRDLNSHKPKWIGQDEPKTTNKYVQFNTTASPTGIPIPPSYSPPHSPLWLFLTSYGYKCCSPYKDDRWRESTTRFSSSNTTLSSKHS